MDVIKCLSSSKFNCNTLSLLNVVKSLIISKIDFALPLYGYSSNSLLKKVKTTMNNALRAAINNLYYETNMLFLEFRRDILTASIFQKTLQNSLESPIYKFINKPIKNRIQSNLTTILKKCKKLEFNYLPNKNIKNNFPSWTFNNSCVIRSLQYYQKSTTSNEIYKQNFLEIKNWFSIGSKYQNHVGYSVTTENEVICTSILPDFSTVFTAEIVAIYEAYKFAHRQRGKFAICSDSLSSIDAISNIQNTDFYSKQIRHLQNYIDMDT